MMDAKTALNQVHANRASSLPGSVVGRDGKTLQRNNKMVMTFADTRAAVAPVACQAKEIVAADVIRQFHFADA